MILVLGVWAFLRALLGRSTAITLESIALRHQLMVLQRSSPRPRLRRQDRILWVCLSRLWVNWRSSLLIVQPATVVAWHRQGFRLYWRWQSRRRSPGRPPIDLEIRTLIRRMVRENPTWGRRRIQAELRFLGYEVAALTVAKYMRRPSRHPSPTWRAFLTAHLHDIAAVDFFVVPTLTFRLLFGFVILRHDRRELIHIGVTDQPTATWAAQQIVHAFPDETGPAYLLRDRDAIYGAHFQRRVERTGIRQVVIAPRAPWQNPFAERVIGSIRRECLDLVIVLNAGHLRRVLRSTSSTTTLCGLTRVSLTIARAGARYSRARASISSQSPRSAGFITAISARPDRPRSPPARPTAIICFDRSVMRRYRHRRLSPCRRPNQFQRERSRSRHEGFASSYYLFDRDSA
jgi:putative transposase